MIETNISKIDFNILIVDDAPKNIQVVANTLNKENYKLFYANNGKTAIEKLDNIDYDLILLDIMMPDIDGFEVCRQLKGKPEHKDIPVIFLTAKSDEESIIKGFEVGGVDYITKPFNKTELLIRVKTHLELYYSRKKLKYMNEKLAEYNKKLTHSNQELDQFASVVAHDLKSPLIAVLNYLEIINVSYSDKLSEEDSSLSKEVMERSRSMTDMIDELLAYSKLSKANKDFDICDTETIINKAMDNLFMDIEKSGAEISYESVPNIFGNESQLISLFQNLISNAIKYNDKKPIIHITSREEENQWVFSVKDNGIGIDPKNKDNVFRIFTRLHSDNEFSGTGLGLSFCRKIVHNHGGEIWLESETGKGSEFLFSIGKDRTDSKDKNK
jgi:two-component system, sensor histidine kinase and response regulator